MAWLARADRGAIGASACPNQYPCLRQGRKRLNELFSDEVRVARLRLIEGIEEQRNTALDVSDRLNKRLRICWVVIV
jgi:hypothetical protein